MDENIKDINFGYRLRELRKNAGLQQSEFGSYFELSPSAIGSYERGEREPSIELIVKFADYFNVSLDYLLGRSEQKLTVEEYAKEYAAQDLTEMTQILKKDILTYHSHPLSDKDKQKINDMIIEMLLAQLPKL